MQKTDDVTMSPSLLLVRFFYLVCQLNSFKANEPTMYDFGLVTEELAKSFDLAAQAHKKVAQKLVVIKFDHILSWLHVCEKSKKRDTMTYQLKKK